MNEDASETNIHAYPMHGYHKMLAEGFRTRDAHILEWLSTMKAGFRALSIYSRPDPFPLREVSMLKARRYEGLKNINDCHRSVLRLPPLKRPKQWWVTSAAMYKPLPEDGVSIVWNPMLGLRPDIERTSSHVHVDLLDNWLIHSAFRDFHSDVDIAYRRLLGAASSISANSEATLELAYKYGRTDAALIPNGCDPERFTTESQAVGPPTLGYVGKIGTRLDVDLIARVVKGNPDWQFIFAGPVLDPEVGKALGGIPGISMLGDIHYSEVPSLLKRFDVGWVPHGVSKGQVGGDAIKIYEYRAAGLPVLTTPIIGTRERPMSGVHVVEAAEQSSFIQNMGLVEGRIPRYRSEIPQELTWQYKTRQMLEMMGITAENT